MTLQFWFRESILERKTPIGTAHSFVVDHDLKQSLNYGMGPIFNREVRTNTRNIACPEDFLTNSILKPELSARHNNLLTVINEVRQPDAPPEKGCRVTFIKVM
jgi:hypothetical protein